MKLSQKIKVLLFVVITTTNIFAGLPPRTMVFMGNGTYAWVQDLRVGHHIPIWDIPNDQLDRQKRRIEEISTSKAKNLILITTEEDGVVTVGAGQKLFNCRIKMFIPAENFKAGDELFSPEKGILTITDVVSESLYSPVDLYDVALESGNIFLILTDQKTHILAHDVPIAVSLLWVGSKLVPKLLAGGAFVVTSLAAKYFTSSGGPGGSGPQ